MATFYLLANHPVQNHQKQDCRLIVQVNAPSGSDTKGLHQEAESVIREKYGQGLILDPISQEEALQYAQSDPGLTQGSFNLKSNVPVLSFLARMN
jgi:hypothetical protein